MISVIIATRNRPLALRECLVSLGKCANTAHEIIIADQSDATDTAVQKYIRAHPKIRYYTLKSKGKSRALNFILPKAKGDIVALTDDDCIASPTWLASITYFFNSHGDTSGVFGKVLPFQPQKHKNMICPCTFTKTKQRVFNKPIYHAANIGFGNNMAFRKKIFNQSVKFRDWLGPGSVAGTANDAYLTLQLLTQGNALAYEPDIVMYHNRWLTKKEMRKQDLSYTCGEMACYGYFHFQGYSFATQIIRSNFASSWHNLKPGKSLYYELSKIFYKFRGLYIAWIYSHVDRLTLTHTIRSK